MTGNALAQDFRLSRIQAQGWAAARTPWTRPGDEKNGKAVNPYTTEPERTRWNTGFANARKGRQGS